MLLWIPSSSLNGHIDEDEKSGKLRRQARARALKVLFFVATLAIVFVVSMVQMQFSAPSSTNGKLRYRKGNSKKKHFHKKSSNSNRLQQQQQQQQQQRAGRSMGHSTKKELTKKNSIYNLSVLDRSGNSIPLGKYNGMVTLIVNIPSKLWSSGSEQQGELQPFEEMIQLQKRFGNQNNEKNKFAVLAFPSKDDFHHHYHEHTTSGGRSDQAIQDDTIKAVFFGGESGSEPATKIGIEVFGVSSSIDANPIYKVLSEQYHQEKVKPGFFDKYLVDRNGIAVAFYPHDYDLTALERATEALLISSTTMEKSV